MALLDLEAIEDNLFRGRQPATRLQRVFGGQVAAHALVAADRTVRSQYHVHSLHSYFLRPGDTSVPIVYDVENVREGRSFATRRVIARQHGRPIFCDDAELPDPRGGAGPPGRDAARCRRPRTARPWPRPAPGRAVTPRSGSGSGRRSTCGSPATRARAAAITGAASATQRLWIRVDGELPDDPLVHTAAFTYASDMTLLAATLVPHGLYIGSPGMQAASLDHTHLVPPALPGRRVVALRPDLAVRVGRARAGPRAGLRP